LQFTIIDILADKIKLAVKNTGIKQVTIGGGVAANSGLRNKVVELADKYKWKVFIPERKFTTDNAAMIAITGYYKYLKNEFTNQNTVPLARLKF